MQYCISKSIYIASIGYNTTPPLITYQMEQSYSEHCNNISENTTTIGLVNGKYYKKKRLVVNLYYRVLQEKNACSEHYYKKKIRKSTDTLLSYFNINLKYIRNIT